MQKFLARCVLFLFFGPMAFAQLTRVEPPFWYAGMTHSKVQLLCYGKNIAAYEVQSALPIADVQRTENPNYLFVTLDTQNASAGSYALTFSAKGKKTIKRQYELKTREPGSAQRKGFDSSDLIYLIMPDRFANGDPSNDNHKDLNEKTDRSATSGRHGGDLRGIINNLDYLNDLGVTAVWNTPVCEDNDPRGSYHGYGQSDVYRIDPRLGTNAEYRELSDELHKRGMKLIKDYVTNHWGAEHWMIKDLPSADWINQFPGYAQSNYRMSTQMDPNAAAIDHKYCVDGWFVKSMPDLNQRNPLVLNYLIQNAIWWIEFANLDGFRVDTYSYCDKQGIAAWTEAVMREYPNFNIVGEVWLSNAAQISYWQKDSPIGAIQSYNTHLPSVMDFPLFDAIGKGFSQTEASWDKGLIYIYDNFVNDFLYPDIDNVLVFAENHDTRRLNEQFTDVRDYKLILSLIATVRGIPQVYYGSEIGMAGFKSKGDGDIRRNFPGGWPGDAQKAFDPKTQTPQQREYFEFTRKLFNWRKTQPVVHSGKTTQYIPEDNVYVYFRESDQGTVMVLLNNNLSDKTVNTTRFNEHLSKFSHGIEALDRQRISITESVAIRAKSALILELKK